MVNIPEVLQKLKGTNINLQEYWKFFDGSLALPADDVLEDTEKLCNDLNKVLFIFKHVARRNHDGIDVYSVKLLLHQQIKWGADGYNRHNSQEKILELYPTEVFVLDKHSLPRLVKDYEIGKVQHILESVAQTTASWFADKHVERSSFTDLNVDLKCIMLAKFLNTIDKYGISLSDSQYKIARFYIATRWANRIRNKKNK